MGGGLERRCTRVPHALRGVPAIAFPEVFLGLIPGWGGSQLLPNLIGADKAVKVILENAMNQNRMLRATQAFELGIADVLLEPADFLEQSLPGRPGSSRARRPSSGRRSTGARRGTPRWPAPRASPT